MSTANFGKLTASATVDLGSTSRTLRAMTLANPNASYNIIASGNGALVFATNSVTPRSPSRAGCRRSRPRVQLDVNTDVTVAAGSSLDINGGVTGSGLTLSMNGSGAVEVVNYVLLVDNAGFQVNAGGYRVLGSFHATGASIFSGPINIASGQIYLTAAAGGQNNFLGAVSGAGGISLAGAGTNTLSASNTYSGGTTVSQGLLDRAAGLLGSGPSTPAERHVRAARGARRRLHQRRGPGRQREHLAPPAAASIASASFCADARRTSNSTGGASSRSAPPH